MKKRTRRISMSILTGLALLAVAGCEKEPQSQTEGTKEKPAIGILQVVQHGSLDAAYEGFVAGLAEAGYKDGETVTLEYQNAQGNQDNLKSMSEKLVKGKPDLLLGIATPASLSLLNETTDIPIVVTAVTDLKAAGLVASPKKPGGNLTGTSDRAPTAKQLDILLSVIKNPKKIGIMYNAGESNSVEQVTEAKKILKAKGIAVKELTANSSNDVQQVTESLAKDVDGIYVPTDNVFANAMTIVGDVAKQQRVPVCGGSIEMMADGGLATYGVDYHSLGKQTAKMAVKLLKGEKEPATFPVETSKNLKLYVNQEMAKALDIDPATIKEPK